jgi:hypothetical protein
MAAVEYADIERGVECKLSGDELLDVVRQAIQDYEWRVRVRGRASIDIYRTPREIRQDAGEPLGALV